MSRFDARVARWAGFGVYYTPAADAPVQAEPTPPAAPSVVGVKYEDTADDVRAEDAAELDRLAELTEGGMAALEACRTLFASILEESADVA